MWPTVKLDLSTRAPSRLAIWFILVAAAVYSTAGLVAYGSIRLFPAPPAVKGVLFPKAFWLTTLLLAFGSVCLARAVRCVRLERQKPFRQCLVAALAAGTLVVGLQTCGLRCLVRNQVPEEAQTGANLFIVVIAALHAMHFSLALLFLVWVTLSALADRYDHEYSWGVVVCAWFWHALGIVWVLVLMVFAIACLPGSQSIT